MGWRQRGGDGRSSVAGKSEIPVIGVGKVKVGEWREVQNVYSLWFVLYGDSAVVDRRRASISSGRRLWRVSKEEEDRWTFMEGGLLFIACQGRL